MRSWEISGFDGGTTEEGVGAELFCRGAIGLAFEAAAKASAARKIFMCIFGTKIKVGQFWNSLGPSSVNVFENSPTAEEVHLSVLEMASKASLVPKTDEEE